ncbi:MAG TPA: LamG domain-containing protein [Puia sp.]|nr:LamG domain-containing protein [Puia sp.]
MRKKFTFLAAFACLVFSLPVVAQQHQALKLNDSNYIYLSNDPLQLSVGNDFTIEFWAYIEDSAMDHKVHQFLSNTTDPTTGFHIGYDGTDSTILIDDNWTDILGNPISTGVKMPVHRWTHIALAYSGTTAASLYVNGVLRASAYTYISATDHFRVGTNFIDPNFFQQAIGKMDDLKIWNIEKSPLSIKRDMFTDPDPTDPTLETWFKLDDNGTATIENEATTTGSTMDGALQGPGAPNSWTYSPVQFSSNGLTFNGSEKDQVIIPDSVTYDTVFNDTKAGTIELWVNPSGLTSSWSTLVSKFGQYSILVNSTQIGIDNGSGTIYTYTLDPGDFPQGLNTDTGNGPWSHLAFVYDGAGTTTIYYNGFFLGTITGSLGAASPGQPLTFGVTKDNTGADSRPYSGGIDEVRLWSSQVDPADIANNYNNTLSGTETNLVSQFSFDQGVPDQDNTGMLTAFDNVASNNGSLANFQLSGTTSNFNLHTLINVASPLPITLTKFTAQRSGSEGLLQWQTAQEENSRDFTIERSGDGKTYTTIGVVAAAGKSSAALDYSFTDLAPLHSINYYRLKQSDLDDKHTYSPVRTLNFSESSRLGWYSTGKLSVEVSLLQGNNESYSLSDISGRTLRQGQLSDGKTEVSHLPAGVYVVRVVTKVGEVLTKKIFLY